MGLLARVRSWPAWVWTLIIAIACVVVHYHGLVMPLFADDAPEVRRALSPGWHNWAFVYSYEAPNLDYPWWWGEIYERRVVRVLPSLVFSAEARIFGYAPLVFHVTNLIALVSTAAIAQRLLARWVKDPLIATVAILVYALHPAAGEMVGFSCNMPVVFAGLASILTVYFWDRFRRTQARGALVGAVIACFVAVTTYEACVLVPIGIAAVDWILFRGSWRPRLAVLAVLAAYVPIVMWAQHGVAHPDHGAMRPIADVVTALRWDTESYVAKTFLLIDPTQPWNYWFLEKVGEIGAVAIMLVPIVLLCVLSADRRFTWIGFVAFAVFLAPPLVTRATVSLMNTPTYRQIYMPMLFGIAPMATAVMLRWRGYAITFFLAFAMWGGLQASRIITDGKMFQTIQRMTRITNDALEGQDRSKTLVVVGDMPCAMFPSFVWHGDIVWAFPSPAKPDDKVELSVVDDRTLVAKTTTGFARVPLDKPAHWQTPPGKYNRGPMYTVRQPAFTPAETSRKIHGATIDLVERTPTAATVLRATLDRPLADSVVLVTQKCAEAKVFTPK